MRHINTNKEIKEMIRNAVKAEILKNRNKNKSYIIAGNWKMNKNMKDVCLFIDELKKNYTSNNKDRIIIFPPYPYVMLVRELVKGTDISYGFQNVHWESSGAFTGEVSPAMAKDLGCKYVIIGHSERRNIFFETDEMINKKVQAALSSDITPILCVGEDLEVRGENRHKEIIEKQLRKGLYGVDVASKNDIIIAYEPVWAIGTGVNAEPEQVEEMHEYISCLLCDVYGYRIGSEIPVLYGGSVKPANILDLAAVDNVSGFLIGGASLCVQNFLQIINSLDN